MVGKEASSKSIACALTLVVCLFAACASKPTTNSTNEVQDVATEVSDDKRVNEVKDEIMVGKGIASKLLGTYGHYDKQPELDKYLGLVGRTVAAQSGRPELTFHFAVLDTDEINALAAPGGYVFVTRGLLARIQNEDELAGVLGHEIAHISERHMYKDIAVKREVSAGESLARLLSRGGADIGGALNQMVAKGMKMLLEDGYGIEKETHADSVGVMYASAAGYDPYALGHLVIRLEKEKSTLKLSKTHPSNRDRIKALKKTFAENGLKSGSSADKNVLARRFTAAMSGLKR